MRRAALWFFTALAVLLMIGLHARLWIPQSRPLIVASGSLKAGLAPRIDGESRRGGLLLLDSALGSLGATSDEDNDVLLFDVGNSLFADASSPELIDEFPQILRDLGYDALTIGYRDFEVMRRLRRPIGIPIVACNISGKLGNQRFVPSIDYEVRGISVRVIGVVDPTAPTIQDANDMSGITVLPLKDSIAAVRRELERPPLATVNVLLSSAIDRELNVAMAAELGTVSLLLGIADGMRGSVQRINRTLVATAQSEGQSLIVANSTSGARDSRAVQLLPGIVEVDSDAFRSSERYRSKLRKYWLERKMQAAPSRILGAVASAEGIKRAVDNPIVLSYPHWSFFNTPMLSFVADAIRIEYPEWEREYHRAASARPVDVVFVNTGSIEQGLPAGIVTSNHLRAAIPYDNKVIPYDMTGRMILDILSSEGMRKHGVLGVSGLLYTWDYVTGAPVEGSIRLVRGEKLTPLREDATYRVVLNDFLATGGDEYLSSTHFKTLTDAARLQPFGAEQFPGTALIAERFLLKHSPVTAPTDRRIKFLR